MIWEDGTLIYLKLAFGFLVRWASISSVRSSLVKTSKAAKKQTMHSAHTRTSSIVIMFKGSIGLWIHATNIKTQRNNYHMVERIHIPRYGIYGESKSWVKPVHCISFRCEWQQTTTQSSAQRSFWQLLEAAWVSGLALELFTSWILLWPQLVSSLAGSWVGNKTLWFYLHT